LYVSRSDDPKMLEEKALGTNKVSQVVVLNSHVVVTQLKLK